MQIKFTETTTPPGKLADAELHFSDTTIPCPACGGRATFECSACGTAGTITVPHPLAGLKLIGFSVWERKTGGGRNVTFPARQYSVNGERRSFALLRPIVDADAPNRIRDLILAAYVEHGDRDIPPATDALRSTPDGFRWAPDTAAPKA